MSRDIAFSTENHLGLVTLQREKALNALTLQMIIELQQQLIAWQSDETIHAVVVQASPGKAFCAGGDIRFIYDAGLARDPQQMQFFWHEYRLNHFIHHFQKPYISLMNGITMGGGVGISLHGSHSVASEQFVFAMPETGIGFFPDIGASYLLSRCPGFVGEYLALTGNRLGPEDALNLQLVDYFISADKFEHILSDLIESDLSNDAHARVSYCLQRLASPRQPSLINQQQAYIDACFNVNDIESILLQLSQGSDVWHRETLDALSQKSPLSLKITLAQIQKARRMSMAECVKMDYCLVEHFMYGHDFYEGVRALLIDKDKSPKWLPKTIVEVDAVEVNHYFECRQSELSFLV